MTDFHRQYLKFLGKRVRELREKMGVSQEEFGKIAKLHRTYIGMIERGEKNITISNLQKISEALKVKLSQLLDF